VTPVALALSPFILQSPDRPVQVFHGFFRGATEVFETLLPKIQQRFSIDFRAHENVSKVTETLLVKPILDILLAPAMNLVS
jgi:hypothetical protein